MIETITQLLYLVSTGLFILSLKWINKPDTARRGVERLGDPVELTGTEYELLLLLARDPGRVLSRDDILNRLRGHDADLYTRAVDIVVSRLRRKLEPLQAIKTLRNAGYALALPRLG